MFGPGIAGFFLGATGLSAVRQSGGKSAGAGFGTFAVLAWPLLIVTGILIVLSVLLGGAMFGNRFQPDGRRLVVRGDHSCRHARRAVAGLSHRPQNPALGAAAGGNRSHEPRGSIERPRPGRLFRHALDPRAGRPRRQHPGARTHWANSARPTTRRWSPSSGATVAPTTRPASWPTGSSPGCSKAASFDAADRSRGKFRSYLLGALKHHLQHERRKHQSARRGGGIEHVALLPPTDTSAGFEVADPRDPAFDREFDRQWALAVLDRAMTQLAAEFERVGKRSHFDATPPVARRRGCGGIAGRSRPADSGCRPVRRRSPFIACASASGPW